MALEWFQGFVVGASLAAAPACFALGMGKGQKFAMDAVKAFPVAIGEAVIRVKNAIKGEKNVLHPTNTGTVAGINQSHQGGDDSKRSVTGDSGSAGISQRKQAERGRTNRKRANKGAGLGAGREKAPDGGNGTQGR